MALPSFVHFGEQFTFAGALGQATLGALVHHHDDAADHFEVAELLGGDVEQHVFAAWVAFGQRPAEVSHRSRKFTLRPAELLEKKSAEHGVLFRNTNGVYQAFIAREHLGASIKRGFLASSTASMLLTFLFWKEFRFR